MRVVPIANFADMDLFNKQCVALERNIPDIRKEELLEDVDGSLTQIYSHEGHKISVHNSYYLDELYIETEIALEKYFSK